MLLVGARNSAKRNFYANTTVSVDRIRAAISSIMRNRYHFTLPFEVRDYECDLQGIVNNAVYQQYLEHTRHRFLSTSGVSFAELTQQGINLVVVRAELDYKHPLRSGDTFMIGVRLERVSPVRFAFLQDLYLTTGGQERLSLTAKIVCAAMNRNGKPIMPTALEPLFKTMKPE